MLLGKLFNMKELHTVTIRTDKNEKKKNLSSACMMGIYHQSYGDEMILCLVQCCDYQPVSNSCLEVILDQISSVAERRGAGDVLIPTSMMKREKLFFVPFCYDLQFPNYVNLLIVSRTH